ncbi:MAG TPA: hypothetical protein VG125_15415 [Pirellulales bacterium]|jgi:hypothetical protein|nr:hypothetical protein [Pirellulales bacterium]
MSGISSDQTAPAGTAYKWRERLLIGAAVALVGCRLLSPRHSVAAMVIATLVLAAVFACYVRGLPGAKRWAFRAALPLAITANATAVAVGSLVVYLAENGLLVHNRLGLYLEWNRAFLCVPLAALVNLLVWAWPGPSRRLPIAAWLANSVLVLYAGWYWRVFESHERYGGAPPFGADLVAALAGLSLATLAWDHNRAALQASAGSSWKLRRTWLALAIAAVTAAILVLPFRTVLRRCRLEAALTSLGCEVTDRTRRPAPLRIRELAPLRPYVTEIEAVYLPKTCLTPATCEALANALGRVTMLDEIDAPAVPAGCERLLSRLGPGSYMQYLLLTGEGITDETLAEAGGFQRLRQAFFAKSRISNAGLAHLAGLPWLETLVLRDTPITGDGLAPLSSCPTLRVLDLSGTQVGDEQIDILAQLPRLSEVDLSRTRVTAAGVEKLRAALPQCQITREPTRNEK